MTHEQYCADFNRVGAKCEEQCPACKKADNAPEPPQDLRERAETIAFSNGGVLSYSKKVELARAILQLASEVSAEKDKRIILLQESEMRLMDANSRQEQRIAELEAEVKKYKISEIRSNNYCQHDWDSVRGGDYYCKICDKYFTTED